MRKLCLSVVIVSLTLVAALAQQNTGRITGSVVDITGAAIPATTVQLILEDGGLAASTTTTSEGLFRFVAIQPLMYSLAIDASGFTKRIIKQVKVEPGRELSMAAVTMEVKGQSETVEVSATVQTVQTTNSENSTTITTEQIRRLPMLNRSPLALISTQVGVTANGRTNTIINGQRPSFSNVTVDGVNVQDNNSAPTRSIFCRTCCCSTKWRR